MTKRRVANGRTPVINQHHLGETTSHSSTPVDLAVYVFNIGGSLFFLLKHVALYFLLLVRGTLPMETWGFLLHLFALCVRERQREGGIDSARPRCLRA